MSNFPLRYKLSWLPRLLKPSLGGGRRGLLPAEGSLLSPLPATARTAGFPGRHLGGGEPSGARGRRAAAAADRLGRSRRRQLRSACGRAAAQTVQDGGGNAPCDDGRVPCPMRSAPRGSTASAWCCRSPTITCSTRASTALPRRGQRLQGWASKPSAQPRTGWFAGAILGGLTVGLAAFSEWRNASSAGLRRAGDHAGRSCPRRFCRAAGEPGRSHLRRGALGLGVPPLSQAARPEPWRDAWPGAAPGWSSDTTPMCCSRPNGSTGRWSPTGSAIFSGRRWRANHGRDGWARSSSPISAPTGTKGQVAAYGMVPFMRLRAGGEGRLLPRRALDVRRKDRSRAPGGASSEFEAPVRPSWPALGTLLAPMLARRASSAIVPGRSGRVPCGAGVRRAVSAFT